MTRVVVVGSGIAGITAALHAADAGAHVVLVTKGELAESNTRYAQGGIAAALGPGDSPALHGTDTLAAGAGLSDPAAVRVLVEEGRDRVRELIALGVPFDRDAAGGILHGLEAAHSAPRILHAGGDATGAAIEDALVARLRASTVEVVERAYLTDLLVDASPEPGEVRSIRANSEDLAENLREAGDPPKSGGRGARGVRGVRGVALLVDERPREIEADAVILATGGAGRLYSHTTNPAGATGDGIAAAIRAGAVVADLEFVQFHPTALAVGEPFLVSEAVRGEGAVLRGEDGRRFAFDAHPDGELAPRDVVARAIHRQMAAQDGRPVLLDATGLGGAELLARRFPTIDAVVRSRGLDWARDPIPVTPAAHYLMGGVATDLDGRTSIPGLFAAGETARTGVHGANRLASNSLLEGAVFGARAGLAAAMTPRSPAPPLHGGDPRNGGSPEAEGPSVTRMPSGTRIPSGARMSSAAFTRAALQELMWTYAGLVRDEGGLAHAAGVLAAWQRDAPAPRTAAEHEDTSLLTVAVAVVAAARARRGSVGAHFRRDAPAGGEAEAGGARAADTGPDPHAERGARTAAGVGGAEEETEMAGAAC